MSRVGYFDYIEEKVNLLAIRINARGRLNLLELNNFSEVTYAYFLNELYGWKLDDGNTRKQNIDSIDLVDDTNKIVVQVSSINTKDKIENSLNGNTIKQHSSYTFKFVSIANDADGLRTKIYKNPHGINFDPQNDIIDKNWILKKIRTLKPEQLRIFYDLVRKELGNSMDIVKLDSNLATIINILAKENWTDIDPPSKINPFEIERKIDYNELIDNTKAIVHEYAIYKHKVENHYEVFDSLGVNKSLSVLQLVNKIYREESLKSEDSDEIFINIGDRVRQIIEESANFERIEFDILVLCIDILLVDAFIRCKIFKNPPNYNYVTS